jgi:zinc protease
MTLKRAGLALGVALVLVLAAGPALADPPLPKKVRTVEGVEEYGLDNGLRVLLYHDDSTPTLTVNLTVRVGSRHEGYGETGMAHLLEHMLFKGTPTHTNIPKALRDHGADFNATTSYDRTNFFETMRATDANLEFGLRLEADRFVNSLIRREDLASEMTVVRSEFERNENDPATILSQRVWANAYEWHNYGKQTIGNRSDIERVPIENLQAFYKKYYRPDNAVLMVAGNFDLTKALAWIAKYFGPLKKPAQPLDDSWTDEPPQDGERTVVLRRVGTVGVVGSAYHIPAAAHEDFAAVELLNSILVSQPTGRLYQALVLGKKCSAVTGQADPLHDPGLIEFAAQVSPGQSAEEARDAMLEVLEKVSQQQPTRQEVHRARARLLKKRELLMDDCKAVASALGEWDARGDWRLFFLHRDQLAKVTADDVARVAKTYLQRTNRTVGLYVPTKEPERARVPARPDVGALVKDFKGGKPVAKGEPFEPTPDNIEKRTQRGQLSCGVKTAVLPKKTRAEAVTLELTLRYGNEESLKGLSTAAGLLPSLLDRGTAKHTREQIEDELDRLQAALSFSGEAGQLRVVLQCKRPNLPVALRLVGEMLRSPAFPAEEFDVVKQELLDGAREGLSDPETLAATALRRRLSPYPREHVRYVPTVEESVGRIEKVTLTQVKKLYEEQLGGAAGELAVVGDFDPEPTLKLVDDFLKGWKSGVPYRRIPKTLPRDQAGSRQDIDTPDKENATWIAGLVFGMTDTDPDYPALQVADFVFGSSPLSSRLSDRVRQKEGLSYSVGSGFSAGSQDRFAVVYFNAICNPLNIDKVDRAIAEELQRWLKDGIEAKELEEGKEAYLEQLRVERADDSSLASSLVSTLHLGRTFAFHAEQDRKIAALTVEQVNAAIRKHLDPKKLVIVRAGDFKKR